jgi:hypothetical protein
MSNNLFYHFSALPMSMRMVYTMTLLVLGTGYLFAMLQVFFSHAGLTATPAWCRPRTSAPRITAARATPAWKRH